MAHSAVHFSIGAFTGFLLALPSLSRAWRRGLPLSPSLRRGLLLSAGCACWAVAPALLRRAGLPPALWNGPLANLFFFHSTITRICRGGVIWGVGALFAVFTLQYGFLLSALARARRLAAQRRARPADGPSGRRLPRAE